MPKPRYDAVLFDLLTALLDSWTLWNDVAGSAALGRKWRAAYLELSYRSGAYRPYESLIAEAAVAAELPSDLAVRLAARYGELKPWPEVGMVLGTLQRAGLPLAVVTNCSERLGAQAVACTGIAFDITVTAERAGFYKPDPRPYQAALQALALPAERCLFVAGSAYDLLGTHRVGLPSFWHNRIGMALPPGMPAPLVQSRALHPLPGLVPDA